MVKRTLDVLVSFRMTMLVTSQSYTSRQMSLTVLLSGHCVTMKAFG